MSLNKFYTPAIALKDQIDLYFKSNAWIYGRYDSAPFHFKRNLWLYYFPDSKKSNASSIYFLTLCNEKGI